jgi:hypothetical protein
MFSGIEHPLLYATISACRASSPPQIGRSSALIHAANVHKFYETLFRLSLVFFPWAYGAPGATAVLAWFLVRLGVLVAYVQIPATASTELVSLVEPVHIFSPSLSTKRSFT